MIAQNACSGIKTCLFGGPVDDLSSEGVETPKNRQILALKGEFQHKENLEYLELR